MQQRLPHQRHRQCGHRTHQARCAQPAGWAPRTLLASHLRTRWSIDHALPAVSHSAAATSLSKDEVHTRLVNYKFQTSLDGGTLTIRPLRQELLQPCAEILADAFVDTEAAKLGPYKRFLQRRIANYLMQQKSQLPRTMILTATWSPENQLTEAETGTADDGGSTGQASVGAASGRVQSEGSSSSSSSSGGDGRVGSNGSANGNGSWAAPRSVAGVDARASGSNGTGTGAGLGGAQLGGTSSSSADLPVSLLGTTELSLEASTRAYYWTLNPPETAAYMANMAVAPQHRRKGIASLLMQAVEELCHMAGQPDMYLHLRFQDAAAGHLYRKCGFTPAKEDVWGVQFLGFDRRYLMHKRLGQGATDASLNPKKA